MRDPGAIEMLREFVEQAQHHSVDADLIGWVAERLGDYLERASDGLTLEHAFGIGNDTSARQWWHEDRRSRWEAALCDLAADFFSTLSPREQAARIQQRLAAYLRGRWRRDSQRGMPTSYTGRFDAALFHIAQLGDGFGESARTIQRALESAQHHDRP